MMRRKPAEFKKILVVRRLLFMNASRLMTVPPYRVRVSIQRAVKVIDEIHHSCDLLHEHLSLPRPQTTNEGKQPLVVRIGDRPVDIDANFVSEVDQHPLQCEEQLIVR
jgi:hypothetical protein